MDDQSRETIAINIGRLVKARGNISAVCRRLGINRQQFNKYLTGQHMPSQVNLNAICDYFGVTFSDLITPDMEIPERKHPSELLAGYQAFTKSNLLQTVIRTSETDRLKQFCGTYYKYHYSSIYRGDIVRAVTSIYPLDEDVFGYTNLERFPNKNNPEKHDYVFKYHGFVFMLDGRMFMADLESLQQNEITFSIYTPIARNPVKFFFGVTSGVASNLYREPYTSKSVLDFRAPTKPAKSDWKAATVLPPDDERLPVEAMEYLDN
ncbi:helix-turn-helix domain-containing protein [Ruegeria atlantica]|uniref:helix-turn-helix domain-containing protein n=1 Tax=Ruegeria atlantica TaxID=81569 RepID=UPI00147BAA5B